MKQRITTRKFSFLRRLQEFQFMYTHNVLQLNTSASSLLFIDIDSDFASNVIHISNSFLLSDRYGHVSTSSLMKSESSLSRLPSNLRVENIVWVYFTDVAFRMQSLCLHCVSKFLIISFTQLEDFAILLKNSGVPEIFIKIKFKVENVKLKTWKLNAKNYRTHGENTHG